MCWYQISWSLACSFVLVVVSLVTLRGSPAAMPTESHGDCGWMTICIFRLGIFVLLWKWSIWNPVFATCFLITSWMGQQFTSVTELRLQHALILKRSHITQSLTNKYASRGKLWWTGLLVSHNTAQDYCIYGNVHLYICILSCNIFFGRLLLSDVFL